MTSHISCNSSQFDNIYSESLMFNTFAFVLKRLFLFQIFSLIETKMSSNQEEEHGEVPKVSGDMETLFILDLFRC